MQFLRLGGSGLRGEVGNGLSPELAIDYASALATYLDGGQIVISRDSRISSPMLSHAVSSALLSGGCSIIDAGAIPAPLMHYAVPALKAQGGLMIGAGHHKSNWNALVPIGNSGSSYNATQTQELLDIYHARDFRNSTWDKIGTIQPMPDSIETDYIQALLKTVNAEAIAAANLKVIVDLCNGTGAGIVYRLAKALNIDLIPLNETPSGILPHNPEPRPRSSVQARGLLNALKADIGFVFNTSMNRLAVVTNEGETLSEEYTFPIIVDHLLQKAPGATIVTNSCTTRTLDDVVSKHGGTLIKTRVGEATLIDCMQSHQALAAGDGTGSAVTHQSPAPALDGIHAMLLILEAMAEEQVTSAALAERLPRYHLVKKQVRCRSSHAYTLLRGISKHFPQAKVSEIDGVRLDFAEGWIHLRASVTEPIIRMIIEWTNQETAEDQALFTRGLLERLVTS